MADKLYRQEAQKILREALPAILNLLERVKAELKTGDSDLIAHLREAEISLGHALFHTDELPDNARAQQVREAGRRAREKYQELQSLKTRHYSASARSEKMAITKQIKQAQSEYEKLETEFKRLRDSD